MTDVLEFELDQNEGTFLFNWNALLVYVHPGSVRIVVRYMYKSGVWCSFIGAPSSQSRISRYIVTLITTGWVSEYGQFSSSKPGSSSC